MLDHYGMAILAAAVVLLGLCLIIAAAILSRRMRHPAEQALQDIAATLRQIAGPVHDRLGILEGRVEEIEQQLAALRALRVFIDNLQANLLQRFTDLESGLRTATAQPTRKAAATATMPAVKVSQYATLPFEPANPESVREYFLSQLPEGRKLTDLCEHGGYTNYTWFDMLRAQVLQQFGLDFDREFRPVGPSRSTAVPPATERPPSPFGGPNEV